MQRKDESKVKEYAQIMASKKDAQRAPMTGYADPFAEASVSDFLNESRILTGLSKAWKVQFCQAQQGYGTRAGGLWFAYGEDRRPKALVHVERFEGKYPEGDVITFWSETLREGIKLAEAYGLKFFVIAEFEDGRYTHEFPKATIPKIYIGSRLQKPPEFKDVINVVAEIPANFFKKNSAGRSGDVDKAERNE